MTSNLATSAGPDLGPPLDDRLFLEELGNDVAIVGAGPAGAALAYILASRGVRTVLLEREESSARELLGEELQPGARRCIEQMGLKEELGALPQIMLERFRLHDGRRSVLVAVPTQSDENPSMVSQPGLLEVLVTEANSFPDFRLLRGVTVTKLVHELGRVVGLETSGYPSEVRARIVVGADGRGSTVRLATELRVTSRREEFDVLVLRADLGDFLPDRRTGHIDLAGPSPILVYPSADGLDQVAVVLPKGTCEQLSQEDRLLWLSEHSSEKLSASLERARLSIRGPIALEVECDRLDRWSEPGVLLIGDAAHTMSPIGGYGIDVALRDAIVAANHLVPVLQEGAPDPAVDSAAAAVATERLPEIQRVQALQTREIKRLLRRHRGLRLLAPLVALYPALLRLRTWRRARLQPELEEIELRV